MRQPGPAGVVAVLLASSGCAQIFGIESTSNHSGSNDAPVAPDADASGPERIGLEFTRLSVGATATSTPMDLSMQTATFLLPDVSDPTGLQSVPGVWDTDGWTANIPTGTPEVEFTLPDLPTPLERIYDLGTRDQKGIFAVLEHPNPMPAPAGATIDVSVTLGAPYTTGDGLAVYTIGSWTQLGFVGPAAGATAASVSYPYAAASNISGQPLSAITTDDAEVVLRYSGSTLVGALTATPFNMIAGSNPITGTVAPTPLDQTVNVTIDPTGPGARFAAVVPAVTPSATLNYAVNAAPGYKIGSMSGVGLISGTIPTTAATTFTANYANPFAARWPSTMELQAYATRAYTPPTGSPIVLYSQLYTVAAPTAGTNFNMPQGLPLATTVGGVKLDTDGATVALDPTKAVSVTFSADAATNTFYQLQLFEIETAANVTSEVLEFGATGAQPSFTLPRALFTTGHTYMLRAICINGNFPSVATGNLQDRDLPVSTGFSDSGVFTVGP